MKVINREFCRFIFWGGVNTLAGYSIYALLLSFLSYLISYSIAYVAGIFISYFLNSKFVFKQELKLSKALKYPLVYVTQYLLGMVCLYLLVQVLRVNKLIAAAIVVLLSIPLTYLLSRRILRGKLEKTNEPRE
jgi:putative flippase GtrA